MKKIIILMVIFLSTSSIGLTQDLKKTEKKVKKLFNKAYYEESLPLLHILMKTKDNDTYINYMFGVCSVETGNETPNKTLQSLLLARSRELNESDLNYYIGRAYQDLFEPDKAISFFKKLLQEEKVDYKVLELAQAHLLECEEAVLLPSDIIKKVIWEKEASYQTFYKLYDYDKDKYGTILLTPEKLSNGNSEVDLAYIPVNKDFIYYSRYDKNTHSKDLYKSAISKTGDYGEPERLNNYINGQGDEEFPIISSDKSSLYFTSTGFKSIGKQDILRTVKSMSGDWSKPTRLGLKVNSSYADFLFFFIPEENIAYFTSNRYHANGKISVYKVELKNTVSKSLATTFFNPKPTSNLSQPDSTDIKKEKLKKKSSIEVAKDNIKKKQFANVLVDSSFIYASKMEEKLDLLKDQNKRCVNIAYNKKSQSNAFYKQYIELASQAANGTDIAKLQSLKTYLGERLDEATIAKEAKIRASHLSNIIKNNEQAYKILVDTLKNWAGHLQLLSASNDSKAVIKEYGLFINLMKEADTARDFSEDIHKIEKENFQIKKEDLLDMDTYLDKKIKILTKSEDNPIVGEERYRQHQDDSKELIEMALVSYTKLLRASTNYQRKYLAKDVISFSKKAQIEQDKLLTMLEENSYDEISYNDDIYETNENSNTFSQDIVKEEESNKKIVNDEKSIIKEEETKKLEYSKLDNSGIRFRVQLGAFGEKTDMKKFSAVPELSKETIPNKQMFRLLSGNFLSYEQATKAKENLSSDFPGAFVVAYQEGEKVSVQSAIQSQSSSNNLNPSEKKNIEEEKQVVVKEQQEDSSSNKQTESTIVNTEVKNNTYVSEVNKFEKEEKAKDIKENKEDLFYLQLGTFSQPKVSEQLYGIEPLFYEILPSNLFRYFTGPYSSSEEAEKMAKLIRQKGAKGAFVVSYKNGEKVKFENSEPKLSTPEKVSPTQQGLLYKIQLGAFSKSKTPIWIKDMEQRTGANIEVFTLDNGIFIYTAGSFSTIEQASGFKQGLINKGFSGIFVAAFKDGKKVPIH